MDRRSTLKLMLGAASLAAGPAILRGRAEAQAPGAAPAFTLPPLGYPYEALEPHIDTATMNYHHKNHHQSFITNLNGLVDRYPGLKSAGIEAILSNLGEVPEAVRAPVRNNLGGHFNHSFF